MSGMIALAAAFLAFTVPIAVPLFVQSWRSFAIVIAAGALFFAWVTFDLANPLGITQALGSFLFGLALFGFAAGVIAKFVMLLGEAVAGWRMVVTSPIIRNRSQFCSPRARGSIFHV